MLVAICSSLPLNCMYSVKCRSDKCSRIYKKTVLITGGTLILHWTACAVGVANIEINWTHISKRIMARAKWGGILVLQSPRRIRITPDSKGASTPAHICDGRHGPCPPWTEWASTTDLWYVCHLPTLIFPRVITSAYSVVKCGRDRGVLIIVWCEVFISATSRTQRSAHPFPAVMSLKLERPGQFDNVQGTHWIGRNCVFSSTWFTYKYSYHHITGIDF